MASHFTLPINCTLCRNDSGSSILRLNNTRTFLRWHRHKKRAHPLRPFIALHCHSLPGQACRLSATPHHVEKFAIVFRGLHLVEDEFHRFDFIHAIE